MGADVRFSLFLLLAACGPVNVELDVVPAQSGTKLTDADIGSVEIILLKAGTFRCGDRAPPYVTLSAPSVRRRVLAKDALRLDDLPNNAPVVVLVDLYREADGTGDIVGSACKENVALKPGVRTSVSLRL